MNYDEYDYYYKHEELTQQDMNILLYLLPQAEHYKWKFISNKLSKMRSKKINIDFCYSKANEMFNLPVSNAPVGAGVNNASRDTKGRNTKSSHSHHHYLPLDTNGISGILGTSIPYLCHNDES